MLKRYMAQRGSPQLLYWLIDAWSVLYGYLVIGAAAIGLIPLHGFKRPC
ncbi:hypothetical protein [Sphingobacterium thalpophilum]|nr:hypothetical protein [Sphingobacterium thalpophilum]